MAKSTKTNIDWRSLSQKERELLLTLIAHFSSAMNPDVYLSVIIRNLKSLAYDETACDELLNEILEDIKSVSLASKQLDSVRKIFNSGRSSYEY